MSIEQDFVKRDDVWQLWKEMGMDTESFVDFATKLYKFTQPLIKQARIDAYEHIRLSDNGMQEPLKSWLDGYIKQLTEDK